MSTSDITQLLNTSDFINEVVIKAKDLFTIATSSREPGDRLWTRMRTSSRKMMARLLSVCGQIGAITQPFADKGIFHKNKAARDKSRLATKVKTLALAA